MPDCCACCSVYKLNWYAVSAFYKNLNRNTIMSYVKRMLVVLILKKLKLD